MTEINNTKFYQFLAKYNSQGGWHNVADEKYGNDDNIVIKAEFRAFVNAEWNGEEGTLTDDLINSFWKSIDTNQSAGKIQGSKIKNLNAIDKNELAAMDKNLEVYVKFNEFVDKNVKYPQILELDSTRKQWKADVVDELTKIMEACIATNCTKNLVTALSASYPNIATTCTAEYCAVEYQQTLKDTVLADYPDYKVADDNILKELIMNYISTLDGESDSEVKENIHRIIDAYLATAGLGNGDSTALEEYGYKQNDNSQLNDIQKNCSSKKNR